MEIKTLSTYIINFEDLKKKFPEIKGSISEINVNDKARSIEIDTIESVYEDDKIVINKEVVMIPKDRYIAKNKSTNLIAEGGTEEEAKNKLNEMINKDGKKQ